MGRFHDLEMLLLLWGLPVLIGLFAYAAYRRKQALRRFAESHLLPVIHVSTQPARRRWKALLILAAFAFGAVAAARPAWNPTPRTIERKGRDVVFLLDVSRSMLAEDLSPNRLERAKLAINDCVDRLRGDRVGLVAFAGTAVIKCPLTLDYGFFRMMLENITTTSVSRGGTMIGDAVRTAMDQVFDHVEKQYKDIILITDGEDHESFPVEAAAEAGEAGIRLIAIGIGNEDEGRRIPVTDESGNRSFLKYNGREVWTRLDAKTLRQMVNATPGGRYLNVATGAIDLGDVYTKLVAGAEKKALQSETVKRYEEKFQIFLAVMLGLLVLEMFISERKKALRH
ncbi:MAG: VWA domain-containing protein [Desulfobacterales bacterium]|nr:VWA domain-containing protein [Desulfobacterales bacterium]